MALLVAFTKDVNNTQSFSHRPIHSINEKTNFVIKITLCKQDIMV